MDRASVFARSGYRCSTNMASIWWSSATSIITNVHIPIRRHESNATRAPVPATTATEVIDTTKGTVHIVIGGSGTSAPSNGLVFNPPACRVIAGVDEAYPKTGKRPPVYVQRPPVYVQELTPWSAKRNAANAYGFAAFAVDPGSGSRRCDVD